MISGQDDSAIDGPAGGHFQRSRPPKMWPREADAVRYMLERDTMKRMCFNPGIVRLAEDFLGCEKRLEEALEAACPEFVSWKAFWVKHGCFTQVRQAASAPTGKIAD